MIDVPGNSIDSAAASDASPQGETSLASVGTQTQPPEGSEQKSPPQPSQPSGAVAPDVEKEFRAWFAEEFDPSLVNVQAFAEWADAAVGRFLGRLA